MIEEIPFATMSLGVQAWVYTREGPILGPVSPTGVVLRPSSRGYDIAFEFRFDFRVEREDLAGHRELTFDTVEVKVLGHTGHRPVGRTRLGAGDSLSVSYFMDANFEDDSPALSGGRRRLLGRGRTSAGAG